MRIIGTLPDRGAAATFSDYLLVQGIPNQIDEAGNGLMEVWVHDEEQLKQATDLLAEYQSNPNDPKYTKAPRVATRIRTQEESEHRAYQKRMYSSEQVFHRWASYGLGAVTMILIFICTMIWIVAFFGINPEMIMQLQISELARPSGNFWERLQGLKEVKRGEVWRLVTPALSHVYFWHFFFNVLWLRELGSMVEARSSSYKLMAFVLVFTVFSNVGQYLTHGPNFLGLSGVVYGLFGYVWIRGKFDSMSGYFIHSTTVVMMLVWFFVCFMPGFQMRIANTAHAVGLILGMAWGYLDARRKK